MREAALAQQRDRFVAFARAECALLAAGIAACEVEAPARVSQALGHGAAAGEVGRALFQLLAEHNVPLTAWQQTCCRPHCAATPTLTPAGRGGPWCHPPNHERALPQHRLPGPAGDRPGRSPLGSHHPEWGFAYPVNYGYLPGCLAPDGEPLDAYILGVDRPLAQFTGLCIAVVHRLDDVEDKLVVVPVPPPPGLDEAGMGAQIAFQERYFTSIILRERPGG